MSAEIDARLAKFARTVNSDRELAGTLAVGLLDRWGVSGFERSIADSRISKALRDSSDADISDTLDFVGKVLQRRTSKK